MARSDARRGQEGPIVLTHPDTNQTVVAYQESVRQKYEHRGYVASTGTPKKTTKKTSGKKTY